MKLSQINAINIDPATLRKRPFTLHASEPTPYIVYTLLKEHYGAPIRVHESRYSQWQFQLQVPNGIVRIRDWNQTSWLLDVYHDQDNREDAEALAKEFQTLLENQVNRYKKRVEELSKNPRYRSIQNIFYIYFSSAEHLLHLAQQAPNLDEREDLCRSAFFLFFSAFEGLLNTIYDLYLKPFLSADDEVQKSLMRAHIKVKLKLAPLYCACFSGDKIDYQPEEFKRLEWLVDLRNNFIHANLSASMKTPIIQEDDYVFLIEQAKSPKYNIPTPASLSSLDITHIEFVRQTIKDMVDAIIRSMNHKHQYDFREAMQREYIIIEQIDGENYIRQQL